MLAPDVRRVLDGTALAHLATVAPDGSPHTAPVHIGTSGDRIVFSTGPRSRKARNLRRDPRVAPSLAPAEDPYRPVIVRGRVIAWPEGGEARAIVDQLAIKYAGRPYPRREARIVAIVEPEQQTAGIG